MNRVNIEYFVYFNLTTVFKIDIALTNTRLFAIVRTLKFLYTTTVIGE